MTSKKSYSVGIYCRLSKDDDQPGESTSIDTQRSMLIDYCSNNQYKIFDIYIDDGFSGLNFNRTGFQRLLNDIDAGNVDMVITKDLSRLGRDYIMTGYYLEIYFPAKGVRYVALNDGFDSDKGSNDFAPFMNILNDMYARDISRKIKAAKNQRAKRGIFVASQAPYGYTNEKGRLIIDGRAAETVRLIFDLATKGYGEVRIAAELKDRHIVTPAAYKFQNGDKRFARYIDSTGNIFDWCPATIGKILSDTVYLGTLTSHKSEVVNYKTKQRRSIPLEQQFVIPNAHEPLVSNEVFSSVHAARTKHRCPANYRKNSLFHGLLFCSCCGHPLSVAHRKLKYREEDMYRCIRHFHFPEECPQTHSIYHNALYGYVLSETQALARSMRRRKVQSKLAGLADISELTEIVLKDVIEKIEVGHLSKKTPLKRAIKIVWKLG